MLANFGKKNQTDRSISLSKKFHLWTIKHFFFFFNFIFNFYFIFILFFIFFRGRGGLTSLLLCVRSCSTDLPIMNVLLKYKVSLSDCLFVFVLSTCDRKTYIYDWSYFKHFIALALASSVRTLCTQLEVMFDQMWMSHTYIVQCSHWAISGVLFFLIPKWQ